MSAQSNETAAIRRDPDKGDGSASSLLAAAALAIMAATALFAGCAKSESSPSSNEPTHVGAGFISIDSPADSTYTTEFDSVYLSGSAFISPASSRCCSFSASDTGVTVTWTSSTGESGGADQDAK